MMDRVRVLWYLTYMYHNRFICHIYICRSDHLTCAYDIQRLDCCSSSSKHPRSKEQSSWVLPKPPTCIKCKTICHTTKGHTCQAFKNCPTSSILSARINQNQTMQAHHTDARPHHNRKPATRPRRAIFLSAYRPSHHIPRAHHTEWSPLHLKQKSL